MKEEGISKTDELTKTRMQHLHEARENTISWIFNRKMKQILQLNLNNNKMYIMTVI